MYNIYKSNDNDTNRFLLGKEGLFKLFVVGLNPSTANKERSDTTASKVEKVAWQNGYDGFVMANLYPLRSTNPDNLPLTGDAQLICKNIQIISNIASQQTNRLFWAAWGGYISKRIYLKESLLLLANEVERINGSWVNFGSLRKDGHPRHPSRLSYSWLFQDFDISYYLRSLV